MVLFLGEGNELKIIEWPRHETTFGLLQQTALGKWIVARWNTSWWGVF